MGSVYVIQQVLDEGTDELTDFKNGWMWAGVKGLLMGLAPSGTALKSGPQGSLKANETAQDFTWN